MDATDLLHLLFLLALYSQCQAKPAHLIWTCPPLTTANGKDLRNRWSKVPLNVEQSFFYNWIIVHIVQWLVIGEEGPPSSSIEAHYRSCAWNWSRYWPKHTNVQRKSTLGWPNVDKIRENPPLHCKLRSLGSQLYPRIEWWSLKLANIWASSSFGREPGALALKVWNRLFVWGDAIGLTEQK